MADEFLLEIFGKTEDGIHTEGIVDAKDMEAFQGKLEALQGKWDDRKENAILGRVLYFSIGLLATRLMIWLPTCFVSCMKLQV